MRHFILAGSLGVIVILGIWAWTLTDLRGPWYERLAIWSLNSLLIVLAAFYIGETFVFHVLH